MTEVCYFEWRVKLPKKPLKDQKYFGNLKKFVIDAGLCSHCTTCTSVCPVYGITGGDKPIDFPNWERECIDCGSCIRVCPRWEYEPNNGIGEYIEVLAAKSKRFSGQDGGMVTEILASAFELGMIDRAVVVSRDDVWRPITAQARTAKQLGDRKITSSKYSFADVMVELRNATYNTRKGVAVTATPCMISGLKKLENEVASYKRNVKLAISLFCMENFYYHQLSELLSRKGVEMKSVRKMQVTGNGLAVEVSEGEADEYIRVVEVSEEEVEEILPSGCRVCQDFVGVESDVSVGSEGSPEGFSTIIVRSEAAKKIIDHIREKDYAEFTGADVEAIETRCRIKMEKRPYRRG